MVNKLAVGECSKVAHTQVNAHIFVTCGEGVRLADFTGENRVKVFSLTLDRQRFDRTSYVPVQVQFDRPDLAQFQIDSDDAFFGCWSGRSIQFPACPIGIGKRVVTVASLEAWIAGLFAIVHTPKEIVIGPLEAQDHILQHMSSDLLILWSLLFDVYQFTFLLVVANSILSRQLFARLIIVVVGMPLDSHLRRQYPRNTNGVRQEIHDEMPRYRG